MPFARHVGNQHAETLVVQGKEVVVVAADLARRHAERRDRQAGHVQRAVRQQRHLNLVRDAQLLFQPLLLGRLPQQILDAGGHRVERLGQLAELIVGC